MDGPRVDAHRHFGCVWPAWSITYAGSSPSAVSHEMKERRSACGLRPCGSSGSPAAADRWFARSAGEQHHALADVVPVHGSADLCSRTATWIRLRVVMRRMVVLLLVPSFALAAPASAEHYSVERQSSGILKSVEARIEIRRVLAERGFARRVPRGMKPSCTRRSPLRLACSFTRTLAGGWRLVGSGEVYVLSRRYGALLRYRLSTTVTIQPPCEGSQTLPCITRARFTYLNHRRVYSGG